MNIFGSPTFTLFHVIISLIGISFGCLALAALIRNKPISFLNHAFLATTAITVVTGFLFPFNGFDPAIGVGIVSSIALLVAGLALYAGHWSGTSRRAYAISATLALYLNVFVAIVQSFQKFCFFMVLVLANRHSLSLRFKGLHLFASLHSVILRPHVFTRGLHSNRL